MEAGRPPDPAILDGSTRSLDRRARTRWAIERSGLWLVLGLAGTIALAVAGQPTWAAVTAGAAAALIAVALVSAALSWRYWSWAPHDDALELRHGILLRQLSVVPYHRIQQIDISRGPVERLLGIATLVLRSAAATTDATIPGIAVEETEHLRHALLARAGVDDAV